MKRCLGIEIGHYRIKLAYMEHGILKKYSSERIDAEFPADRNLYAELIQDMKAKEGIHCKNTVFVLPPENVSIKRLTLPLITVEQLMLNLPYEFGDYIGDNPDNYQFDYAVLERRENQLELLAAACKKEDCEQFLQFAKLAKLKMVGLVPAVIGLQRILNRKFPCPKNAIILDLGFHALQLHFFQDGIYDTTHTLKPGCEELERIYSENHEELEQASVTYERTMAVRILRSLHFYSYDRRQQLPDALYYCGGGFFYQGLLDELHRILYIPLKNLSSLCFETEAQMISEAIDSPQTIGVLFD